jgi:hypothetical protein
LAFVRLRKASIALLVGMLAGGALSPLLAGLLVCTDGSRPDCCPGVDPQAAPTTGGRGATLGERCDCCVEIEAFPPTLVDSAQKRLYDAQGALASVATLVAPPPAPIALQSTDDARDNSPSSVRSAVLRL